MLRLREGYDDSIGSYAEIVDEKGNVIVGDFKPREDGSYVKTVSSGDSTGYIDLPDLNELNRQYEAKKNQQFGAGLGPALGYEYATKNENGDIFRKFDAQGNLTEYMDRHGNWQSVNEFKPTGVAFDENTSQLVTTYEKPGVQRSYTEKDAQTINRWGIQRGGFLGENGWKNLAGLVATGLTAGFAAPAIGAIQGATGLGTIGAGALYGGATGALSGAITGGGQGALQGGLLGAAAGGLSGALGGGGAEAFPVDAPNANFTGMDVGNAATWGVGEFQPFAGGDVGLGSGYITQFNPDGSFVTLPTPNAPEYTYTVEDDLGDIASNVQTEEIDPNARVLTAEEAENLMKYNILPADMQVPAGNFLDKINSLFPEGAVGNVLKSALVAGGLSAASALMPKQGTSSEGGGFTAEQLQAIVAGMPSAMQDYITMAQGTGAPTSGFGQFGVAQGLPNLFPNYVLPTTGQYGAGRFTNIPAGGIKV